MLRVRHEYFEFEDKPHKLLARQLRGSQANKALHKIKSEAGDMLVDPKAINDRFREYYEQLYTSRARRDISNWLGPLNLPKLSDDACEALNSDITIPEITDAIKSFPNGKAAGPDAFGIELYKKYSEKFALLSLRMFTRSLETQKFPDTLYDANK